MSAIPKQRWTAAEYLAFERRSEEKHEFFDGDVYLMSGASREHNLIVLNTGSALLNLLDGRPCETYVNDMRVRVDAHHYFYPDIAVTCDKPAFEDAEVDTLLNPTVVIEVLSPSTEMFDHVKKFQFYRTLTSLQEYVLIAQDSYRVERYTRQPDDQWLYADIIGIDGVLQLRSIESGLSLKQIYKRVTLEQAG